MRKFVKTVAVLALAVSVLSTSAFAAFSGNVEAGTIAGTYSLEMLEVPAGDQVTLLAVDTQDLASVTGENIYYIDQNDTGAFNNFQLKDGTAGKKIFFFAGSSTTNEAIPVGSISDYVIELKVNSKDAETIQKGATANLATGIAPADYEDAVSWTITPSTGAEFVETPTNLGADFKATEVGTYTVTATLANGAADSVTITVEEPSFDLTPAESDIINTTPDGEIVQVQHGVGVMIDVDVPAAIDKMIWVLVGSDGTRYYSDAIDYIQGTAGSVKAYAAFPNGNNGISTNTVEIIGVDAIFRVDDKTAYYTNEAEDRAKGPDAYKAAE